MLSIIFSAMYSIFQSDEKCINSLHILVENLNMNSFSVSQALFLNSIALIMFDGNIAKHGLI